MQKGAFDDVEAEAHGRISKQTVELDGVSVTRVRFDVGVRWSNDLKDYAGTESCQFAACGRRSGRRAARRDG
jgi:hypothetical protein